MVATSIRFISYPRTQPPPDFVPDIVHAFADCEGSISSRTLPKGLTSDEVLAVLRPALTDLGFSMESSKLKADRIERPVFYGENGIPALTYRVDAYHSEWRCGLEVEAGRGWMGNAIYRDLVQALVMVQV